MVTTKRIKLYLKRKNETSSDEVTESSETVTETKENQASEANSHVESTTESTDEPTANVAASDQEESNDNIGNV